MICCCACKGFSQSQHLPSALREQKRHQLTKDCRLASACMFLNNLHTSTIAVTHTCCCCLGLARRGRGWGQPRAATAGRHMPCRIHAGRQARNLSPRRAMPPKRNGPASAGHAHTTCASAASQVLSATGKRFSNCGLERELAMAANCGGTDLLPVESLVAKRRTRPLSRSSRMVASLAQGSTRLARERSIQGMK